MERMSNIPKMNIIMKNSDWSLWIDDLSVRVSGIMIFWRISWNRIGGLEFVNLVQLWQNWKYSYYCTLHFFTFHDFLFLVFFIFRFVFYFVLYLISKEKIKNKGRRLLGQSEYSLRMVCISTKRSTENFALVWDFAKVQ